MRRVLDAAAPARMPADPRLWLGGAAARRSSYPACQAVKAAAEQGLDGPYLRRCARASWSTAAGAGHADALLAAVRGVPGLDLERFAVDLRSNAIVEAFGADLDRARERRAAAAVLARRRSRGSRARRGVAALRGRPRSRRAPRPRAALPAAEEAVRRLGRVATAEVAAACDLPGPRAPAELWRLASEWRVRPERVPRRRALARRLGGGEELARVGELGPQPGPQPRVELGGAALGDPDGLAGLPQASAPRRRAGRRGPARARAAA